MLVVVVVVMMVKIEIAKHCSVVVGMVLAKVVRRVIAVMEVMS